MRNLLTKCLGWVFEKPETLTSPGNFWSAIGQLLHRIMLVRVQLIGLLLFFFIGRAGSSGGEDFLSNAVYAAISDIGGWPAALASGAAVFGCAVAAHALLTTWTLAPVRFPSIHRAISTGAADLDLRSYGKLGPIPLGRFPLGLLLTTLAAFAPIWALLNAARSPLLVVLGIACLGAVLSLLALVPKLPPAQKFIGALGRLLGAMFRAVEPGYVDKNGVLRPGHLLAALQLATLVLLYLGVRLGWPVTDNRYALTDDSAILYLFLWLTMTISALSGVAFFFDRMRVPLLLVLLVFGGLMDRLLPGIGIERKHVFEISDLEAAPNDSAESSDALPVLSDRLLAASRRTVFVSAEGGGIRAAAWTAHVLAALEAAAIERSSRENGGAPDAADTFSRRLALLSATSGGAVGGLHYLAGAYLTPEGDALDVSELQSRMDDVVRMAGSSSLEAATWGLVYPDFQRLFFGQFPGRRHVDRGWALERDWESRIGTAFELEEPTRLRDFARLLADDRAPAFVFNVTETGTGTPVWISNARLDGVGYASRVDNCFATPGGVPSEIPCQLDYDMRMATAARLSATFPIVSPSARRWNPAKGPPIEGQHFVDGGYFDNTGDFAVLRTLRELLRSTDEGSTRAATASDDSPNESSVGEASSDLVWVQIRDPRCAEGESDDSRRGLPLPETFTIPARGLYAVRGSSQRVRSLLSRELLLEADSASARDNASSERLVHVIPFEPTLRKENCPPLSWALSTEHREELARAIEDHDGKVQEVMKVLFE